MIINSHVHINTDSNYFFYNNYGLSRFLGEMKQSGIDMAFPTLNPKVSIFRCPNDCSMNCPYVQTSAKSIESFKGNTNAFAINNNLNACNCKSPHRHRVVITKNDDGLVLKCKTCGKVILKSEIDPLRSYNIALIYMTKPYRHKIKPLIYISLCDATIQTEIDFFEENYPNEFIGFKLHPWNDQVSVAKLRIYSSKPILIHTGIRELESAKDAITFAENNPEIKVVVAHAAALDEGVLRKIAQMDNVYLDCCPSVFMYESKLTSLFPPNEILSPEDIYYTVLDFLPSNKILFGTDSPWGNSEQELAVVRKLKIMESIREQILFKNAIEVYLQ